MKKCKAIFLDKDGTLIEDIAYNVDPGKIRFYPDVPGALKLLRDNGFELVVISNQSGVAHGYFEMNMLDTVSRSLQCMAAGYSFGFSGFYYCPHHPKGIMTSYAVDCGCRKPKPGMLLKAAEELNIDLACSWMIGDILNDVEAGNRAGCKTILIDNGNETEWIAGDHRTPVHIVKRVCDAAEIILAYEVEAVKKTGRQL